MAAVQKANSRSLVAEKLSSLGMTALKREARVKVKSLTSNEVSYI